MTNEKKERKENEIIDQVIALAHNEARKLKIIDRLEDVNTNIPFFQIKGNKICIGGYKNHDNANRMIFWAQYLQKFIMPFQRSNSLNGYFNIELHDSYSHTDKVLACRELRKQKKEGEEEDDISSYKSCLVWSKHKEDDHVVLLPDLYHLVNFNHRLSNNIDTLSWNEKNDKIGFWGTTTGLMNPTLNERIKACIWFDAMDSEHLKSDCYITNIAQMTKESIYNSIPSFPRIYKAPVQIPYQYQYKFLLDIPGNTCSWDRIPLAMNSHSLLFKTPCADMCFYYPLLKNKEHYVDVTVHDGDVFKQRLYYLNNPKEASFITNNANRFSQNVFTSEMAHLYTNEMFKHVAYLHGR